MTALRALAAALWLSGHGTFAHEAAWKRLPPGLREPASTQAERSLAMDMTARPILGAIPGADAGGEAPRDGTPPRAARPDGLPSPGVGLAEEIAQDIMGSKAAGSSLALRPARDGMSLNDRHQDDRSGTVKLPLFGRRF